MGTRQTLIEEGTKLYTPDGEIERYYCPFATFQDDRGEKSTVWGRNIANAINAAGVMVGDVVDLIPLGLKNITIQSKQLDGSIIEKGVDTIVWAVQPINKGPCVADGIYSGKIVSIQDGVAIQKIGRDPDRVVRHDLNKLSHPVKVGEILDIAYKGGQGVVGGQGVEKAGQER